MFRRPVRVRGRAVLAAGLLFYALYFAGVLPGFAPAASALPLICIAAMMALSVWLPFASGQLSLAQAGFMALGAYGSAWLTVHHAWPFGLALATAAISTALIGLAVAYPALRLKGIYLAIATLGLGEVIRVVFLNLEATGGAFGFSGIARRTQTWHLAAALGVTSMLLFGLTRGRIGRAMAAVRHDATVAAALGVEITRVRVLTFTLGALLAGLAGGFQAHYIRFIAPENYDLAALIEWIAMMILGGFQTFVGVLAGTLVIGTLPEMLHFMADWRLTINGVLLMLLLVLRPQGIVTRELTGWRLAPSPADLRRKSLEPELPEPVAGRSSEDRILAIDSLEKRFGGVTALDSVSFSVRRNAIHGVIGPNGAGKTTLFNVITGLYRADSGRVLLDGEAIDHSRPQQIIRRGMARTFQNIRLFGEMSVLENVMLGAHVRTSSGAFACALGLDRVEEHATAVRALALLKIVGLATRLDDAARSLPYGDQRKVEIARALASGPNVLLLDEPVAGMNKGEAEALAEIIRNVRLAFGITVVLIDHDMDFVMSLCDSVTVLDFGRVIAAGDPASVQRDGAVQQAYLGTSRAVGRPG